MHNVYIIMYLGTIIRNVNEQFFIALQKVINRLRIIITIT